MDACAIILPDMTRNRKEIDSGSVGAEVRRERELRGWSGEEFGFRLGVGRSFVSRLETGESKITPGLLNRMGRVFSWDKDQLVRLSTMLPISAKTKALLQARSEIETAIRELDELDRRRPGSAARGLKRAAAEMTTSKATGRLIRDFLSAAVAAKIT